MTDKIIEAPFTSEEPITLKAASAICNRLQRYNEIEQIVKDFNNTRDSSPMVERACAEYTKIEKAECFDRILELFKE